MPLNRMDVLLNVADVDGSLAFYRDLIGMQVDDTWTDETGRTRWAKLLASGGSSLMLNQPSGQPLTDRADRPGYRDVVIYLRISSVGELDTIHRKLCESGARPGECQDETYGQREFIVRDPDGYELAIAAPLGS